MKMKHSFAIMPKKVTVALGCVLKKQATPPTNNNNNNNNNDLYSIRKQHQQQNPDSSIPRTY
jgi:hypothetical protein